MSLGIDHSPQRIRVAGIAVTAVHIEGLAGAMNLTELAPAGEVLAAILFRSIEVFENGIVVLLKKGYGFFRRLHPILTYYIGIPQERGPAHIHNRESVRTL